MLKHHNIGDLWTELPIAIKEKICKQHGFGDYHTYANYGWTQFQPHTREALTPRVLLETDALRGFNNPP